MTNWRTNLGGAISVTGTLLISVGTLTQLTQLSPNTSTMLNPHQLTAMWYVALVGFVLSAIGKGVTALFSADAKVLKQVVEQSNAIATQTNVNTVQIADTKKQVDETTFLTKGKP